MNLSASHCATIVVFLLCLMPAPARAEIFAVPFMGVRFGGSTSIADLDLAAGQRGITLGGSVLVLGEGILGYEADFGYVPGSFERDNQLVKSGSYVIDLTGGVVLALPPGATRGGLRPYFVVGMGLINAHAEDVLGILVTRRTVPAYKLGGGATGMLTNNAGVRFDLRHVHSFNNVERPLGQIGRRISYWRFTVGVLLRL